MFALLLLLLAGAAWADKRRRVVVLPFEGEKAEKFHGAVIKIIKKTHTVVGADKWESTAEELSAAKLNNKNIKKVAKKLKVDGVVEGSITKRRDEYIIKLKLYSGTTGEVAGTVQTKAEGPRLDGQGAKDVKDELLGAIGELDSVRDGGGDDEEEPKATAKGKGKKGGDEEEEDPKGKKGFKKGGDDEDPLAAKGKEKAGDKKKKGDDEEVVAKGKEKGDKKKKGDDEELVAKGKEKADKEKADKEKADKEKADKEKADKKKGGEEVAAAPGGEDEEDKPKSKKDKKDKKDKKVATGGDDGGDEIGSSFTPGEKLGKAAALSPGNRAVDAAVGMSFNMRRLTFSHDLPAKQGLGFGAPSGYGGPPAPGAMVDITIYPLAFGHKSEAITKNVGLTAYFDQALVLKVQNPDNDNVKEKALSRRFAVGGVFRYPLGKKATAPVVAGRVRFGKQVFDIGTDDLKVDIPDALYTIIDGSALIHFPINPKITINGAAGAMAILNTGDMQSNMYYGQAKVLGLEFHAGADYALTPAIFVRGGLTIETIGYTFKGTGMFSNNRDTDPEQDVFGARDTYINLSATIGYAF